MYSLTTKYALLKTYAIDSYHLRDAANALSERDENAAIDLLKKQFWEFNCRLDIDEISSGYRLNMSYDWDGGSDDFYLLDKKTDLILELVRAFQTSCNLLTTDRQLQMFVNDDRVFNAIYSYAEHIRSDDYDPFSEEQDV